LYNLDFVVYLYGLNLVMVSTDLALYFRNLKYVKKEQENASSIN
jgi:hypothetical protein